MIRKIQWIAMVVAAVLCAACDAHIDENVSTKVVKLIQSYTGVVDKMIWRK